LDLWCVVYHVAMLQEVAGLMGDANYWKHEAEFQAYRKLFWDTVSLLLISYLLVDFMCCILI